MTKKLKDSIHQLLFACYNGSNVNHAIHTLIYEHCEELSNQQVWDKVYEKIRKCFEKHNRHKGSGLALEDYEGLLLEIDCKKAEKLEKLTNID